MSTLTIPTTTFQVGQTSFGPMTPGAGLTKAVLTVGNSAGAAAAVVTFALEVSEDSGATWQSLISATMPTGVPVKLHDGTTTSDWTMTVIRPTPTTAQTRLRGSLTVSGHNCRLGPSSLVVS